VTATNDQIVAEANRRGTERGWAGPPVEHYIIEVVREGWTPPPVDPDLLAVREIAAARYERMALYDWAHAARKGELDAGEDVQYPLAAYKAGREVEAERAKVLLATLDDIQQHGPHGVGRQASATLKAYKAGKEAAQ
jgi:hypothetical protein